MTFQVTFKDKPPIAMEVHRAELRLALKRQKGLLLDVNLLGTRPGLTTDDRAAPGWDAPVGLNLVVSDHVVPDDRTGLRGRTVVYDGVPEFDQGFFYYWDHESLARLGFALRCDATGDYAVEAEGQSESGHVFRVDLPLHLLSVTAEAGMEPGADLARALFPDGVKVSVKEMRAGGVIAQPEGTAP
ncbi:hypothetical protein FIU89_01705 [Roseovarius sp. THAF27]|uniref:hypothetical protein n=1 Tax=Roseovarius sp. THAF27 TaxID=2587850 RepID=UPI001268EFF2|nr:hypothetical protein [Roseovarius sp. THAF27]QFT79309.1 hypothetical protein FIU89_01705 [Roseovarius sp. THAF27]